MSDNGGKKTSECIHDVKNEVISSNEGILGFG